MHFRARSTRGGPLSVRTTLALLVVSSAFVAAVGARTSDDVDPGAMLGDANGVSGEMTYRTAARPDSLSDLEAVLSDLPRVPDLQSPAARPSDAERRAEDALVAMLTAGTPRAGEAHAFGAPSDIEVDAASLVEADAMTDLEMADALEREAQAHLDFGDLADASAGPVDDEAGGAATAEPQVELAPGQRLVAGEIGRGDSLSTALRAHGIRPSIVHIIASELSPIFDFTRARPGQTYQVVLDGDDQLVRFDYRVNDDASVQVARDAHGVYRAKRSEAELEPHVVRMAGVVETSLYDAIRALGEDGALASSFARVFSWQFDFDRDTRAGDEFHVLYERLYRERSDGRLEYVKPGRILAARYRSGETEYEAVHFDPTVHEDAQVADAGGYYRTDGTSLERQFLRAPLDNGRVTSGFSNARRHPILKITRPHHGIDYAAPRGTPLYAVADGTVIHKGRAGGFGNLVKVRHAGGYVSYYSHLQGFAKGLHVGQKVSQKQVLGFVGSTGLATGPHTCFRIAKNGQYLNPRTIESQAAEPIHGEQWAAFASQRDELLQGLDGSSVVAVQDAL